MSIKVSVIIPAYNTEQYIAQAISSALSQSLTNLEIIVVDDCSTDHTVEVVKSFADPRLKLLSNPKNLGAGGSRNQAIEAARGEWIAVLDSDDWYASQRLETLIAIAEQKNADFIADDLYLIEEGNSSPWGTLIGESGATISSVKEFKAADFILSDIENQQGLRLGFSKPLFKKKFIIEHNIRYKNIKVGEDFWFDMQCFLHGARFFLVPKPYYYYRARSGSLVASNKIERLEEGCEAVREFMQYRNYLDKNPSVANALEIKMNETKKWLHYYRLVEPLKKGQIVDCVKTIYTNPVVFKYLMSNVPQLVQRRLKNWKESQQVSYQRTMFKT